MRSINVFTLLTIALSLLALITAAAVVISVLFTVNPLTEQYTVPDMVPEGIPENGSKIDSVLAPEPTMGPYEGVSVGFSYSLSGMTSMPAPEYWYNIAANASNAFDGSRAGAIWVVGLGQADGNCFLSFPSSAKYHNIVFSPRDQNEEYLDYFDSKGMSVILQVEPVMANVSDLIRLVLDRYSHHPCVTGIGIDVEWYQAPAYWSGKRVTDEEASMWYSIIASYDTDYTLALTHWETSQMPPTYRTGLYFLYDGQKFHSFSDMEAAYISWGNAFPDNPVGFYIGFPTDKKLWSTCQDPFYSIARTTLDNVKNAKGIYWVSFSIKDIHPF